MSAYRLDYLQQLEAESIHIFREVAAQFERPALLFSAWMALLLMRTLLQNDCCIVHGTNCWGDLPTTPNGVRSPRTARSCQVSLIRQ